MEKISLDGAYRLYFYDARAYSADHPDALRADAVRHIAATVPGNAELDLSAAGILPADLYRGNNILSVRRFEPYDFWYEREFSLTEEQLARSPSFLFEGVDTIASYFLNGVEIGASRDMLIPVRIPLGAAAKVGRNVLHVKLASATLYAAEKEYPPYILALPVNQESAVVRKAPHVYGWDIMPRAVSAGLWRGVSIELRDPVEITDVYLATTHLDPDKRRALIWFHYHVSVPRGDRQAYRIRITGVCGESKFAWEAPLRFVDGTARIAVDDHLKLWNPRGYGEAALYDVVVRVVDAAGAVAAEYRTRFGIRLLVIEYSEKGGSDGYFRVRVNHTQILVKGTNWVPADAFHSRDAARIADNLDEVLYTECNAVRCWGGNVYENDFFFDLCDRYGLLVWQDFAMACSQYPHDEDFLRLFGEEAKQTILRIRNHCSLMNYCGDNECDVMTYYNRIDPATNPITRSLLPAVVADWDPFRVFIPSSPYISPASYRADDISSLPENHLWGPRDNFKSAFYTRDGSHFIGEIGYHGCPNLSSIRRFVSPEKVWPPDDNDEWITHCTAPDCDGDEPSIYAYRIELMSNQIRELFGSVPADAESFVLASQISQAEAKKFFIEYTRQRKWDRSGILWWNAVDGWPQFSDAVVDYYRVRKLAAYYIRRSQRPVTILMKEPDNWRCEVIVANDSDRDAAGEYRVTDADSGEVVLTGSFRSPANVNVRVGSVAVSNGEHRLFLLELTFDDGNRAVNHYLHGHAPFDPGWYRAKLEQIAALDDSFRADRIGK